LLLPSAATEIAARYAESTPPLYPIAMDRWALSHASNRASFVADVAASGASVS
jgi:hypothetical protein